MTMIVVSRTVPMTIELCQMLRPDPILFHFIFYFKYFIKIHIVMQILIQIHLPANLSNLSEYLKLNRLLPCIQIQDTFSRFIQWRRIA